MTEGAMKGYIIKAMINCELNKKDIEKVMAELKYLLDIQTEEESEKYYQKSPY